MGTLRWVRATALALIASSLAACASASRQAEPPTSPAQVPPGTMVYSAASTQPAQPPPEAGWKPIEFEQVRLYVPPDWTVYGSPDPCAQYLDKSAWLSPPTAPGYGCGPPPVAPKVLPGDTVRIQSFWDSGRSGAPTATLTIHGYRVERLAPTPGRNPPDLAVVLPGLNPEPLVTLGSDSPTTEEVLHSLGPSDREVALRPGPFPTPPRAWRTVRLGAVSLEVPRIWPLTDLDTNHHAAGCGFGTQAGVYIQTRPRDVAFSCPGSSAVNQPEESFVWVYEQAGAPLSPFSADNAWAIKTPSATLFAEKEVPGEWTGEGTDVIELWLPGPKMEVSIGLGMGGAVARTILASIRVT